MSLYYYYNQGGEKGTQKADVYHILT